MKMIYISGQMSGPCRNTTSAFFEADEALKAAGYDTLNPAAHGIIDGWAWADYLRHDLHDVLKADGIATLRLWRKSPGARLEVHVGSKLGLTVQSVACWVQQAAVIGV